MADFAETARARILDLSSEKAAVRREAAYYLGEAGVDEAITKLVVLYRNDPDPSVREAARYALGMFRAVKDALEKGEEEHVVALLTGIVEEGKLGRRATTSRSRIVATFGALLVLLLVLVGANLAAPTLRATLGAARLETTDEPAPTTVAGVPAQTTVTERSALLAAMREVYSQTQPDVGTLLTIFQTVSGGGALNCTAFFNFDTPRPFAETDANAYPDLAPSLSRLNLAQETLVTARARYDRACFDDQPLQPDELGALVTSLTQAQTELAQVDAALASLESAALATEAVAPLATAEATPDPAVAGTEAVAPAVADPRRHLGALFSIIDNTNSPRGANGLLKQYWQDVQAAGFSDACDDATPPIPEDYVLPEIDRAASTNLGQAVDQINLGLQLVREGWRTFQTACAAGTLTNVAGAGFGQATTAETAFNNAQIFLQMVRDEG